MHGYVHRQPQKHIVHSIHLLANKTANILVSNMAQGKQDMMEVFISKKAGKVCHHQFSHRVNILTNSPALYDLLSGRAPDSDHESNNNSNNLRKDQKQKLRMTSTSGAGPRVNPRSVKHKSTDTLAEQEEEVDQSVVGKK